MLQQYRLILKVLARLAGRRGRARGRRRNQQQHQLQQRCQVGSLLVGQPLALLALLLPPPSAVGCGVKRQQRRQLGEEARLPEHELVGGGATQQRPQQRQAVLHHNPAVHEPLLAAEDERKSKRRVGEIAFPRPPARARSQGPTHRMMPNRRSNAPSNTAIFWISALLPPSACSRSSASLRSTSCSARQSMSLTTARGALSTACV